METVQGLKELETAIKDALRTKGSLATLQAQVRSHVLNCLVDKNEMKPPIAKETFLMNELIREYLLYNGYSATLSVFHAETNAPKSCLQREQLTRELNLETKDYPSDLPLLYGIACNLKDPLAMDDA